MVCGQYMVVCGGVWWCKVVLVVLVIMVIAVVVFVLVLVVFGGNCSG